MLHFLAYFEHCSLSSSPRAGLQLPSCTPNRCSVSQFYSDLISRATWVFQTHLWACQDLSAASPTFLPVLAAPRLLPLLDARECKERPQSLVWRGDMSYINPIFFSKFRAFYTKSGSFLLADWGCPFCVLLCGC